MHSLRTRLFVVLAIPILATGLAAGAWAFRWSFEEAIELQDGVLRQVGDLAVRVEGPLELSQEGIDADARIMVEELGKPSSHGSDRAALPGLPADLPEGLQTVARGDATWRLLVLNRSDGRRIAIGQPTSSRDEIAHGSAVRTIVPLAALLPVLLILVAIIIRRSFQTVSDLAARVDAKPFGELDTLPMDGMPEEIVPFVASINRLLERIGLMLEHERRFIAGAAHELRTPITALSLQAENVGHHGLPPEAVARLNLLKSGVRRVAHLLEQLLAASRYESIRTAAMPVVSFDAVVKSVVGDHLKAAEARGVDLGFTRMEAASVEAEATSLSVLARNLIDNALRHTPEGGRIDVALFEHGSSVSFIVEDTGPGIPEAELGRVFEPFVRSERSEGEGSGLGLSIVRSIVQRAGGSTTLENVNTNGRSGLRAIVSFPRAKGECSRTLA